MAYAKAVGIGRLVALGAEEVALDVRGHVAVRGRRARAERKARLAGVGRHLVLFLFAGGGGPREWAPGGVPGAGAVYARAAIGPCIIPLYLTTQAERGLRSRG